MKVENELLTVNLEKGLTLGQIMANFKHVVIGDVNAHAMPEYKSVKSFAAVRATSTEEDAVMERIMDERSYHKYIVPNNANHMDIVFYFDKKGTPTREWRPVSSVRWAIDNGVFRPDLVPLMETFLVQCNETKI